MALEVVHIVPGFSAAGAIKQALGRLGLKESVIGIGDHLGYGPIDGDLVVRRNWLDENLGEGYGECVGFAELNWQEALAPDAHPIIWTCRNDPGDYACFLDFLERIDGRPFEVVDVTGSPFEWRGQPSRIPTLSVVSADQFISATIPWLRRPLPDNELRENRQLWHGLKAENALLRVVENDTLRSKPISYYDAELLKATEPEWERGVRIVGNALARFRDEGRMVSDAFIWSRYLALHEEGKLDIDGEGGMRECKLRSK